MRILKILVLFSAVYSQLLNVTSFISSLQNPTGVAVDQTGRVLVVDSGGNRTLFISPNGTYGAAHLSSLSNPVGVTMDTSGSFYYLTETGNNTVKNVSSAVTPAVSIFGNGTAGYTDGNQNSCQFNNPSGIAIGSDGNVYVADTGNNVIRMISYNTKLVSTFAGSSVSGFLDGPALSAKFSSPQGVALDSTGNLFIADSGNNVIRKFTRSSGQVTVFAGSSTASGYADASGTAARFNNPTGIAIDLQDNIYVADTGNNAIRKITAAGMVVTVAGNTTIGYLDGLSSVSTFKTPRGLAIGLNKTVFIADSENNAIREISPLTASISGVSGNPPTFGGQFKIVLRNVNVSSVTSASIKDSGNFSTAISECIPTFSATYTNITCIAPSVPYYGPFSISLRVSDNFGDDITFTFSDYYYQSPIVTSIIPNTADSLSGATISIFGNNFGSGSGVLFPPNVIFGQNACLNTIRVNDSLITCTLPVGVGSFTPVVKLNDVDLNNTLPFAYTPPKISSFSPLLTFSSTLLTVTGTQLGNSLSQLVVILTNTASSQNFTCINVGILSTSTISCKIPYDLPAGNFSVTLIAGNQGSNTIYYGKNTLAPVITSINPSQGPTTGNTTFSMVVQNLVNLVSVNFNYTVNSTYYVIYQPNNCVQSGMNVTCKSPTVPFSASFGVGITDGTIIGPRDFFFTYFPSIVSYINPSTGDNDGGYQIEIWGQNFGTGPGALYPPAVSFGPYSCLNAIRNDTLITCTAPAGIGSQSLSISLSGIPVLNNATFSYFPPAISYLSPSVAYASTQLTVTGSHFGISSTAITINLVDSLGNVTLCIDPRWQTSTSLSCKIPAILQFGNYTLDVIVGGQKSAESDVFPISPPPPPIAYDVTAFGLETTIPSSILITLNVTSIFSSVTYIINSLPNNGTLYLGAGGNRGVEVRQAGTPFISGILYYIPNQYYSGSDSFIYSATDPSPSSSANVNITIGFVNQAPNFPNPKFSLPMNESVSSYTIDLVSLIFDPDEHSNYTIKFIDNPIRGIWRFNGKLISDFSDMLLLVGQPNVLQVDVDKQGGGKPYFEFKAQVYDSFGLVSTNILDATGDITCNQVNALNTWESGPICVPCPVGAICSPTGDFPITNQFGYYGVSSTLNNETTVLFLECVPPEACPARQFKFGKQTCATGYSGSRCGTCDIGYYTYGSVCNKCANVEIPPVVLGLIAFVVLAIVLYVAYRLSKMDVGFIGVVYTYFQIAIFIKVSPECFRVTSPSDSFEFKYYATLAIPICIIATGTILYVFYFIGDFIKSLLVTKPVPVKNSKTVRLPSILSQLCAAILLSMKFLFLTLATTTLSIYNCTYEAVNGKYYFEPAPSRFCYIQSWWWDLLPYSVVAFVMYIIGTIALSTAVDTKAGKIRKDRVNVVRDAKVAEILTSPVDMLLLDMTQTDFPVYKPEFLYWDAVIMIRKLLIGIIINFMTHTPETQCVLLIMIFQLSLVLQNKRRPYYKDNINELEEVTLISASTILLIGLVAASQERQDPVFVLLLGIVIITFICGSGIFMCWKIIYHYYLGLQEVKRLAQKKIRQSYMAFTRQSIDPTKRFSNFEEFAKKISASKESKSERNSRFHNPAKISRLFRQPPSTKPVIPLEPVVFQTEAINMEKTKSVRMLDRQEEDKQLPNDLVLDDIIVPAGAPPTLNLPLLEKNEHDPQPIKITPDDGDIDAIQIQKSSHL